MEPEEFPGSAALAEEETSENQCIVLGYN